MGNSTHQHLTDTIAHIINGIIPAHDVVSTDCQKAAAAVIGLLDGMGAIPGSDVVTVTGLKARRETLRQIKNIIDARKPWKDDTLQRLRDFCEMEERAADVSISNLEVRQICPGCLQQIDPEICHCGDSREGHGGQFDGAGHGFVTMGCDCMRYRGGKLG